MTVRLDAAKYYESIGRQAMAAEIRESRTKAILELRERGVSGARIFETRVRGRLFFEADNLPNSAVRVLAISEGRGNPVDRNYYTKSFIESLAPMLAGAESYYNHSTVAEEKSRPERDVRDKCGWFADPSVKAIAESATGRMRAGAIAMFHPRVGDQVIASLLETAREKAQLYPDAIPFVSFSIAAYGAGAPGKSPEDGSDVNLVEVATDLASVDVVTLAGARGRPLFATESTRRRSGLTESGRYMDRRIVPSAPSYIKRRRL